MAVNEVPGAVLAARQWQLVQELAAGLAPPQAQWLSGAVSKGLHR